MVYPWLMPAVRYEWIQPDYSYTGRLGFCKAEENPVTTKNFEWLSFDVAILLRANVGSRCWRPFLHRRAAAIRLTLREQFRIGLAIAFKARKGVIYQKN